MITTELKEIREEIAKIDLLTRQAYRICSYNKRLTKKQENLLKKELRQGLARLVYLSSMSQDLSNT